MGDFDTVTVRGAPYVCAAGHDMTGDTLQTKDLGCTVGHVEIGDVGSRVMMRPGSWSEPLLPGFTGTIQVYMECRQCPALVHLPTGNVLQMWFEVEIEIVDDIVQRIARISTPNDEQIADYREHFGANQIEGPMPLEAALDRCCDLRGRPRLPR